MTERAPAFATVVLDVDSTVSGVEGIDWLASLRDSETATRITLLTDRAMRGELPLEAVYGARLDEIRPTRDEVNALAHLYVERMAPGCPEAVARLRHAGVRVLLVSGGLRNAMDQLARVLELDPTDVHAVRVRFDEQGAYAGFDERSPLTMANGKSALIATLGLAHPMLMVGDGATDLAARSAVDSFAAFTGFAAREAVVRHADLVLSSFAELTATILEPR